MGYRKLFKAISLAILAGVLLAAAVFAATKAWRYHEYTTVGENGIAQTDAVTLRGTAQYLFIRGYRRDKPLLLFLLPKTVVASVTQSLWKSRKMMCLPKSPAADAARLCNNRCKFNNEIDVGSPWPHILS